MSPGSLIEASSGIFVAVTFALLGFVSLGHLVLPCSVFSSYLHYSAFIFVFNSTVAAVCSEAMTYSHASYIVWPCFFLSTLQCVAVYSTV